jgi:putative salt-induced outer membrane protein YdiY
VAVLTAALSIGAAGVVQAGMVRLKNGDVITGKILTVSGDAIVIETEHSGEVTVDTAHVVDVQSERVLTIEYEDGREVDGYVDIGADGKLAVLESAPAEVGEMAAEEAAEATVIDLSGIKSVHEVTPYFRYLANVQMGVNVAKGNSDNENVNLAAAFVPSFGKNTIALDGQWNRGKADGELNASNWRVNGQYEREFWDKWYWLVFNSYEQDSLQDLDLRITAATGLGYKFFEPDPTLLRVSLGPAYVNENFKGSDDDRQFAALRWTLDFDQDIFSPDVSIYHRHKLTVGLTESQIVVLTAQGLRIELIGDLALLFEFQFDHVNSPAEDAKQNDYRYLFKLAYDFSGDENDYWQ